MPVAMVKNLAQNKGTGGFFKRKKKKCGKRTGGSAEKKCSEELKQA